MSHHTLARSLTCNAGPVRERAFNLENNVDLAMQILRASVPRNLLQLSQQLCANRKNELTVEGAYGCFVARRQV